MAILTPAQATAAAIRLLREHGFVVNRPVPGRASVTVESREATELQMTSSPMVLTIVRQH